MIIFKGKSKDMQSGIARGWERLISGKKPCPECDRLSYDPRVTHGMRCGRCVYGRIYFL